MSFINSILNFFPTVIAAILLLALAFVVAFIAKAIVKALLTKIGANKILDKTGIEDQSTGSSIDFVANLVFLIVFLLFLPGVLDRLGMNSVSAPIQNMVSSFLGFVPNLVAAVLIMVIGVFVAKAVRNLLIPLLNRLNLNKIQEKAGIEVTPSNSITNVIATLVYILILIPVAVAALNALNIAAISTPAISMLDQIFAFIPSIACAIILVVIGVFIAKLASNLVETLLAGAGADTAIQKIIPTQEGKKPFAISKYTSVCVNVIINLLFIIQAVSVLHLEVLTNVGAAIIAYLPYAISAVIIITIAVLLGRWVEGVINKNSNVKISGALAKYAIIVIGVFMTLSQLGIANQIVMAAFIIILLALAVAFAIAFGIGGKDFASHTLKKLEDNMDKEDQN